MLGVEKLRTVLFAQPGFPKLPQDFLREVLENASGDGGKRMPGRRGHGERFDLEGRPLRIRFKSSNLLDLVAEEVQAEGHALVDRIQVDNTSANGKLSGSCHFRFVVVTEGVQSLDQPGEGAGSSRLKRDFRFQDGRFPGQGLDQGGQGGHDDEARRAEWRLERG